MINKPLVVLMIVICFLCSGCSKKKTDTDNWNVQTIETVESETESASETVTNNNRNLTVPSNKKEEELFGTIDRTGQWTAPESSYANPKTGVIYNKEGVAIGNSNRT